MKKLFAYLFGFLMLSNTACTKQAEKDAELIQDYLNKNNLSATAQSTSEGIYYIINPQGTGVNPTIDNRVTVHYEGFLLDGTKFDSSRDRGTPSTFPLAAVIQGWQIGIPKFKKGGRGKLVIPSAYAYGKNPPSGSVIPKNAVLVFDIELLDVQ